MFQKKVPKHYLNYNNFWRGLRLGEENLESVKHATVLKHTFTLHPNLSGQKDQWGKSVSQHHISWKEEKWCYHNSKGRVIFFVKLAYLYLLSYVGNKFKGKNITPLSKKIFMFYLILLLNTVISHSVVSCKSNYMRNMYCILK